MRVSTRKPSRRLCCFHPLPLPSAAACLGLCVVTPALFLLCLDHKDSSGCSPCRVPHFSWPSSNCSYCSPKNKPDHSLLLLAAKRIKSKFLIWGEKDPSSLHPQGHFISPISQPPMSQPPDSILLQGHAMACLCHTGPSAHNEPFSNRQMEITIAVITIVHIY